MTVRTTQASRWADYCSGARGFRDARLSTRSGAAGRVAFADFGWRESGVLGEFDGKRKYQRDLREGEDPGEVVFREKQREDWLRRLGWTVCRFVWADLFTPDETAARFRAAFRDAARLPRPA